MDLAVYSAAELPELPEAAVDRDRLNFATWGGGLTEEQYLERERQQWRSAFSRGGLRLWVLRDGSEDLASLETYAVPVVSGAVAGVGHGIASVFVEERLRKRGLATALLTQVHGRLRDEGALLTYLMSEIGAPLYEALGYRGRPLRLRRLAASDPGRPDLLPNDPRVQFLSEADLGALLRERYLHVRPAHLPRRSALTLLLTPEQIVWHVERARFYAGVLRRPPPASVGVRAGDTFALWAPEYRARKDGQRDPQGILRVLTLFPGHKLLAAGLIDDPRSPEAAAVRDVLHAARDEAARLGLNAVEIWENALNPGWLRGGLPMPAEDLPMLLSLRQEIPGAEEWLDWERGHWL